MAGALAAFIVRMYERSLDRQLLTDAAIVHRLEAIETKVQHNQEAVIALQTTSANQSPFFTELQSRLIDSLHHPDPAKHELDALLEHLKALTLTAPDLERLQDLLTDQAAEDADPVQRKQSRALLAIMPLVLDEARADRGVAGLREAAIPVRPNETRAPLMQLLELSKDIQQVTHITMDTVKGFADRRDRRSTDPIGGPS